MTGDPRYRSWLCLMVERHGFAGARELSGVPITELVEIMLWEAGFEVVA